MSSLCNLSFYGQVVGHAETVRQLQAADSARQLLQDSMDVHLQAEQEAKAKQVPIGCIFPALADALSASSSLHLTDEALRALSNGYDRHQQLLPSSLAR